MSTKHHAIVIGSGIAGPAVALFLRKIGIDSTIYEARGPAIDVGGGMSLTPNGMNVLRALGLADRVRTAGTPAPWLVFRNEEGSVLARVRNGRPDKHGQPVVSLRRAALQRILTEAVKGEGIPVEYGKTLRAVREERGGVSADFHDGSTARGTLLVGADGVHSAVRRSVLPAEPPPSYQGALAVGGFVRREAALRIPSGGENAINITVGRQGSFGFCNMGPNRPLWGWWSRLRRDEAPGVDEIRSLSSEAIRTELLSVHGGWHEPIVHMIEETPEIVRTPIHDIPTLSTWSSGRSVLVGDAVHAMSPHAGQGASMALEDAMCLAVMLRRHEGYHAAAFQEYEEHRRARAERAVAHGRRSAGKLEPMGPVATWMRDRALGLFMRLAGERSMDWMYSYRIEWKDLTEERSASRPLLRSPRAVGAGRSDG